MLAAVDDFVLTPRHNHPNPWYNLLLVLFCRQHGCPFLGIAEETAAAAGQPAPIRSLVAEQLEG